MNQKKQYTAFFKKIFFSIFSLGIFLPVYAHAAGGTVTINNIPANFQGGSLTINVSGQDVNNPSNTPSGTATVMINAPTGNGCTTNCTPTASLTNGPSLGSQGSSGTYNVGDTIYYVWSSTGANQWSSTWSTSQACGGSGTWVANNQSGNSSGVLLSIQAGCTYILTYTATNTTTSQSASSVTTVTVNNTQTQSPSCLGSAPTCTTSANNCGSTNSGHQICTGTTWGGCDVPQPANTICSNTTGSTCPTNNATTACTSGSNSCSMTNPGIETCTNNVWGSCSATTPSNASCTVGVCGDDQYLTYPSVPHSSLCTSGNAGPVSQGYTGGLPAYYYWYCSSQVCSTDTSQEQTATTQYSITVNKTIGGGVTSSPGGINCGTTCVANYDSGTQVNLTPVPDSAYWKFIGWAGDCSGTGSCSLNVTSNKTVSAKFIISPFKYGEF